MRTSWRPGHYEALTSKTRIIKGLFIPNYQFLFSLSLWCRTRQNTGAMKREAMNRNVDIYKALGVKAPGGPVMVPIQTPKSRVEIHYPETIHCIWSTVSIQQACAVWTVWVLNSQLQTRNSSETVKNGRSINHA